MSRFLVTSEAAEILRCTPANVRALERAGKLSAERTPSGRRIFNTDDVKALAQLREQQKRERIIIVSDKGQRAKAPFTE